MPEENNKKQPEAVPAPSPAPPAPTPAIATDPSAEIAAITAERDKLKTSLADLEGKFAATAKGVPADRAARYLKLAESYLDDKTDLAAALDKALADFPLASAAKGVPGAGGNPPPKPETPQRPSGTVIF
ncbi:hypothetical protein FACS1894202_09850 [Clostridia bacterium]|nr:hypothetical protein FACS1894202_09850 [Clostridia bacterium]